MRRTEYPCGEPERDNSSWCCSTRRSVKITHLILIFWTKNDNIRQVFGYVDMKELEDLLAQMASRTLWYNNAVCRLLSFECGTMLLSTTALLSPNM